MKNEAILNGIFCQCSCLPTLTPTFPIWRNQIFRKNHPSVSSDSKREELKSSLLPSSWIYRPALLRVCLPGHFAARRAADLLALYILDFTRLALIGFNSFTVTKAVGPLPVVRAASFPWFKEIENLRFKPQIQTFYQIQTSDSNDDIRFKTADLQRAQI